MYIGSRIQARARDLIRRSAPLAKAPRTRRKRSHTLAPHTGSLLGYTEWLSIAIVQLVIRSTAYYRGTVGSLIETSSTVFTW